MGALRSFVKAVQSKVEQSRSGSDVVSQVTAQFDENMEGIRQGGEVPEFYVNIPGVYAAQSVEAQLLEYSSDMLGQLQADGRTSTIAEVRVNIIEAVRDTKIRSLEADGNVSPFDAMAIKGQAGDLKQKARSYLMGAKMSAPVEMRDDIGAVLDVVEERMLGDAVTAHGRNYEKWMRAAQGAIWAVAELRLQQLVR